MKIKNMKSIFLKICVIKISLLENLRVHLNPHYYEGFEIALISPSCSSDYSAAQKKRTAYNKTLCK